MRFTIILLIFTFCSCGDGAGKPRKGVQDVSKNSHDSGGLVPVDTTASSANLIHDLVEKDVSKDSIMAVDLVPKGNWTNIAMLMPEAKLDIRYATTNNFVKKQLYECPTCWLRPDAAIALQQVQQELISKGYNIVLFDCYRPRPVQQALWEIMPNATYVTPPSRGSMHNRGKAVDLSLTDLDGNQLDMGTPFDFFGRAAHVDNRNHPAAILERRDLLTGTMEKFGFRGIRTEWWHFSFGGKRAELSDELWKCD